ncbi:MAG TPA: glycosyltransferase family 4 protein [Gemmatimonadales bacterium]|nr:glycosyltransferase family 4 protein [Gemmatimonadales bacterium]
MKLLLFIHSLGGGGAERVMAALANQWAVEGRAVVLVTLASRSGDRYALDPAIRRLELGLASESSGVVSALAGNARRVRALRRVLRAERPDVAVAMLTTCNVLLALAGARLRVRLVGSERVHPPQVPLGGMWARLRAWCYGGLDTVVVQTRETAEWVRTHTRARRLAVVPNPVTWPLPSTEPVRAPGSVGTPGRRRLLAVGRLEGQKRFGLLIALFARLAPRFPEWELVIVGDGPDRAVLERQVAEAGLIGRIMLPGHVGNMADWYACADLFVLSSKFEGFPNVLAEAMAHGLPVVSSDCDTGPRDIVRHEVDGLLVPTDDEEALAAALARLMGDADARSRFAMRAVEVRERFAMSRIAAQWDDVLSGRTP